MLDKQVKSLQILPMEAAVEFWKWKVGGGRLVEENNKQGSW